MNKKQLQKILEERVINLYESGKTQKEIAKELGISNKTVSKILKKHGITAKVSKKQLDFLFELFMKHFEVKDPVKLRQDLNFLSLKQVRAMIMTLMNYEKLKRQMLNTENKLKYYEKMFSIERKEEL